jgi:hypothetical protein
MQGDLECQCITPEIVYKFSAGFTNNIRYPRRVPELIRHMCLLCSRRRAGVAFPAWGFGNIGPPSGAVNA